MNIYISLLFATIRSALRAREDVALENLALRHQLAVMTRAARRLRLGPADRIVVVLFGASRIGDIGKGLGRGIREFRHELHQAKQEEPAKTSVAAAPTGASAVTVTTFVPSVWHTH